MKFYEWLFSQFDPIKTRKVTWLTGKFSRWRHRILKESNKRYEHSMQGNEFFEVPGAGKISISKEAHVRTGGAIGFSFGVSWGEHGYTGGVLGRTEAKRLTEFILKECENHTESEADELTRRRLEYEEWKRVNNFS